MKSNIHIMSARYLISITTLVFVITSTTAIPYDSCINILDCAGFTGVYLKDLSKQPTIDKMLEVLNLIKSNMSNVKNLKYTEDMLAFLTNENHLDQNSDIILEAIEIFKKYSKKNQYWEDLLKLCLHYLKIIKNLDFIDIYKGAIKQLTYEYLNNIDNSKNISVIINMLLEYRKKSDFYITHGNYKIAYCKSICVIGVEKLNESLSKVLSDVHEE